MAWVCYVLLDLRPAAILFVHTLLLLPPSLFSLLVLLFLRLLVLALLEEKVWARLL